jgi:hypothetical protein
MVHLFFMLCACILTSTITYGELLSHMISLDFFFIGRVYGLICVQLATLLLFCEAEDFLVYKGEYDFRQAEFSPLTTCKRTIVLFVTFKFLNLFIFCFISLCSTSDLTAHEGMMDVMVYSLILLWKSHGSNTERLSRPVCM